MRRYLIFCVCAALVSACGKTSTHSADIIFLNARAYTLEADRPWAEAVAVSGGEIVFVGDNAGALALADETTAQYDLGGKMLLPGFIDTHMHLFDGAAFAHALSLNTEGSIDEWLQAIRAYADQNPDAPVIFGYGWLASAFGPDGPTRQMIDALVSDRPVLLLDEGFHAAWANTRALESLNITKDTPDPVPGLSYYKRDANGDATGYLLERTSEMAAADLEAISEDSLVAGATHVAGVLNRFGITSIFSAGAYSRARYVPGVMRRLGESDEFTIRVIGAHVVTGPNQLADAVHQAETWRDTVRGERYHYRQLKILNDGTVEARTAAMFEDYQGEPGNKGDLAFTQEQLAQMVSGAAAKDIDVHIHGIGDRAVHEALDAIESARESVPDSKTRYTICHVQVIADDDLPRFAELDVIAQSTPLWATYDFYGEEFVSEDQFNRYFRFKSLKDLGVRLSWGSDFPATGVGELGLSPVVQIELGHTRQYPGEPDSPIQPRESERLDIASLIRGYTIDAAYQLHMEDQIGSLAPGKKADLVVLDRNLFETDAYEIHQTGVKMTVMDGRIVYAAGDPPAM